MIISSETVKKAKDTLAEHFYNYLSSFVVELAFPSLCEEIGIEEEG